MTGKNATCPGSGCSTEMPSNRYSLVRGRPPLMRGSCDPGGSATPGASAASVMKLRPFERQRYDSLLGDDAAEAGRSPGAAAHRRSPSPASVDPPTSSVEVEPHRLAGLDVDAVAPHPT